MPIFIPSHLTEEPSHVPTAPILGTYYGLHDITGRTVVLPDLIRTLAKLRQSDAIRWVALLNSWVSKPDALTKESQLGMANAMLTPELRDLLHTLVREREETWCIFQEYITRVFRHFAYDGDSLVRVFYASPKFKGGHDEAGDGILIWPRAALVMSRGSTLDT